MFQHSAAFFIDLPYRHIGGIAHNTRTLWNLHPTTPDRTAGELALILGEEGAQAAEKQIGNSTAAVPLPSTTSCQQQTPPPFLLH